jgi:hypothetical protein
MMQRRLTTSAASYRTCLASAGVDRKSNGNLLILWWSGRDSNPRPRLCQCQGWVETAIISLSGGHYAYRIIEKSDAVSLLSYYPSSIMPHG